MRVCDFQQPPDSPQPPKSEEEDHETGTEFVPLPSRQFTFETVGQKDRWSNAPAPRIFSTSRWTDCAEAEEEDSIHTSFTEDPEASDSDIEPALQYFHICTDGPDGKCIVAENGIVPDRFVGSVERRLRALYGLPMEDYPFPQNLEASYRDCLQVQETDLLLSLYQRVTDLIDHIDEVLQTRRTSRVEAVMRMILAARRRLGFSRERLLRKVIVVHPDIHHIFDVARDHSEIEEESAVCELNIIDCSEGFAAWYRGRASDGQPCKLSESPVPLYGDHHGLYSLEHNASYPWVTETDGEALILLDISSPRQRQKM